jgi:hypothetical protein
MAKSVGRGTGAIHFWSAAGDAGRLELLAGVACALACVAAAINLRTLIRRSIFRFRSRLNLDLSPLNCDIGYLPMGTLAGIRLHERLVCSLNNTQSKS